MGGGEKLLVVVEDEDVVVVVEVGVASPPAGSEGFGFEGEEEEGEGDKDENMSGSLTCCLSCCSFASFFLRLSSICSSRFFFSANTADAVSSPIPLMPLPAPSPF